MGDAVQPSTASAVAPASRAAGPAPRLPYVPPRLERLGAWNAFTLALSAKYDEDAGTEPVSLLLHPGRSLG